MRNENLVFDLGLHDGFDTGHLAIAESSGTITFYRNRSQPEWSSLYADLKDGEYDEISVQAVTCDWLVRHFGVPHYIKIDIEGADKIALSALQNIARRPCYISVETGPGNAWIQALHDLGYRRFKLVDQAWIQPPGSSGPFGESAPGKWLSFADACRAWTEREAASSSPWLDIHAGLSYLSSETGTVKAAVFTTSLRWNWTQIR